MGQIKAIVALTIMGVLLMSCKKNTYAFEKLGVRISRFTVNINTAPTGEPERLEADWGVLIRPNSTDDSLLRLVIYCHSGGGLTTDHGSEAERSEAIQYLVSIGYAVLDFSGMPRPYSARIGVDPGRTAGSPIALRSALAAYDYVINNFNIAQDGCFVMCNSNGGLVASNIINLTHIPVLAQAGLAPLLSTERNAWDIIYGAFQSSAGFKQYQIRANIIRLFGMNNIQSQEELDNAKYDKQKVGNYDPFDYCLNQTKAPYPVPYLIFAFKDDSAILYPIVEEFSKKLNERGSSIEISSITEYGAHNVAPNPIIVGDFTYMGEVKPLRLTVRTIGDFFNTHNPDIQ